MFTMSMQQFVVFARDCKALAPSTPVTVGEVRAKNIGIARDKGKWKGKGRSNGTGRRKGKGKGKRKDDEL